MAAAVEVLSACWTRGDGKAYVAESAAVEAAAAVSWEWEWGGGIAIVRPTSLPLDCFRLESSFRCCRAVPMCGVMALAVVAGGALSPPLSPCSIN